MTQIILDIETIPSQKPGARDHIRASVKPPGTLKKAESIAAWWATEADAAVEEGYRKQSLDGGTNGEIVAISLVGYNLDDDQGWSYCRRQGEPESAPKIPRDLREYRDLPETGFAVKKPRLRGRGAKPFPLSHIKAPLKGDRAGGAFAPERNVPLLLCFTN